MRLLFSSCHGPLVDAIGRRLTNAGISCEVRYRAPGSPKPQSFYRELWITSDNDLQWALTLVSMHCQAGRN